MIPIHGRKLLGLMRLPAHCTRVQLSPITIFSLPIRLRLTLPPFIFLCHHPERDGSDVKGTRRSSPVRSSRTVRPPSLHHSLPPYVLQLPWLPEPECNSLDSRIIGRHSSSPLALKLPRAPKSNYHQPGFRIFVLIAFHRSPRRKPPWVP